MNQEIIIRWLESAASFDRPRIEPQTTDELRPAKRQRRLPPSPPLTVDSSAFDCSTPTQLGAVGTSQTMTSSPTKRSWRPDDDAPRAFDLTPRAPRTRSTPTQSNANNGATDDAASYQDTTDSQSHRSAATSTSRTSSKAPKVSRNSSPTKQFRNAEIQETGFRTASFDTDGRMASHLPASLRSLLRDLRKIERADGILPEGLHDEVR